MLEEQNSSEHGAAAPMRERGDDRLFISYSRRDAALVRALYDGLAARGIAVWVDWEDIPPSAEWWAEIRRAIDSADAFAFVISPDSIASTVCSDELAHAVAGGKRLIPLLHREASAGQRVPDALACLNWIFAQDPESLPTALDRFVQALTSDLALLRMHARLLVRAREWEASVRNASYLLRGVDLDNALQWLGAVSASGPMPTDLHRDYLVESQRAQREQSERWRRLYEEALSRDLASRSQLLVDQRGTALPLAALLAIEAARRSPSLQTDQALRKVLRLLPLRHATIAVGCAHHTVAPGAERLATVAGSHLEVWALDRRERLLAVDAGAELLTAGLSLMPFALSADGTLLAAVVGEREVRVWEVDGGGVRLAYPCDTRVRGLAFSHDAASLAITLDRPVSLILDLAGGAPPASLEHASIMDNVAWRPDRSELVLWGAEAAEVWNPVGPQRTSTIPLGYAGGPTTQFAYSPRGEYLALLQRTIFAVNVFHVASRRLVFKSERHVDLAFHPEDKAFAVASPEWDVTVWDLPTAAQRFRMMHDNSAWRVGFNGDGTRLFSESRDGTTRVWELERKGAEVARFVDGIPGPRTVVFSADGWRLYRIFEDRVETADARGFVEWRMLDLHSPVFDVDTAPDHLHLALGTRNGSWLVADYSDLSGITILDGEPGRNASGEQLTMTRFVTPRQLIVKRATGGPQLRNLATAAYDAPFPEAGEALLAVSRNGRVCRVAGGQLVVWGTDGSASHAQPVTGEVRDVAISGDGAVVAVLGAEDVRFASGRSARRLQKRKIVLEGEVSAELDMTGARLALWRPGDDRSVVRVIDVATGETSSRWELPSRLHDLRFDATGEQVVLALKDGSVQVWRSDAGIPLAAFQHPVEATVACFTMDPGLIASGSWDGTARIWPWLPGQLIRIACARLDRDMTPAEWAQYLPGEPYRATRTLT